MSDLLLAPLLSLFSLGFYRRVSKRPVTMGFLYLAYLCLFFSFSALVAYRFQFYPVAHQFVQWLGKELPQLTVTQKGLEMDKPAPVLLSHPQWGAFLYMDPEVDLPKTEDLEKAIVILTRTHIAYREPAGGQIRMQKFVPDAPQRDWRDFAITGDRVILFWLRLQPYLASFAAVGFFFLAYLWKLLATLVYSLIALLLNLLRKEKLPYSSLLNITFFAMTPIILLQLLTLLLPGLRFIPLNFLVSFLITTIYLGFGILGSQSRGTEPQ